MMKPWSRLCFLVLAISSLSRGKNGTTVSQPDEDHDDVPESTDPSSMTPAPLTPEAQNEPTQHTFSQTNISADGADLPPTYFTIQGEETSQETDDFHPTDMTEEGNNTAAQPTTTAGVAERGRKGEPTGTPTTVSPVAGTSAKPADGTNHSSWGYVILVLIILVIIILCVILYFLRRVSRTYSFDLQRPVHNHINEPTGTFEPVYLDDLDLTAPKDQMTTDDLSPPPAANGTTVQSEEKATDGDNAPQEKLEANGLETSLTSITSPSLGDDPADKTSSPLSGSNLFLDATGEEQQNENNNNPSVCSSDPFVEINLDDPAWSDQLLTSPEGPSSVLPFSPFSFSSSSS